MDNLMWNYAINELAGASNVDTGFTYALRRIVNIHAAVIRPGRVVPFRLRKTCLSALSFLSIGIAAAPSTLLWSHRK